MVKVGAMGKRMERDQDRSGAWELCGYLILNLHGDFMGDGAEMDVALLALCLSWGVGLGLNGSPHWGAGSTGPMLMLLREGHG